MKNSIEENIFFRKISLVSLVAVFMRTRRTAPDARVVEPDDSDRT